MTFRLIVGTDEGKLWAAVQSAAKHKDYAKKEFILDQRPLEPGDAWIEYVPANPEQAAVPVILVERKEAADLSASIGDGRKENQKIRMKAVQAQQNANCHLCYVVEGFDEKYDAKASYQPLKSPGVLRSTMISMVMRDGFGLFQSRNLDDTAAWLVRMLVKVPEYVHLLPPVDSAELPQTAGGGTDPYLKTIKQRKEKNLTPHRCFCLQLAQYPRVSIRMASVLAEHFGSWSAMLTTLTEAEDPVKLVADIVIPSEKPAVKGRRFGQARAKTLVEWVLPGK